MLLNNAECLILPETELKIIYRWIGGVQNPTKHLKWSIKERLTKTNYILELLPIDITKYLRGI